MNHAAQRLRELADGCDCDLKSLLKIVRRMERRTWSCPLKTGQDQVLFDGLRTHEVTDTSMPYAGEGYCSVLTKRVVARLGCGVWSWVHLDVVALECFDEGLCHPVGLRVANGCRAWLHADIHKQ